MKPCHPEDIPFGTKISLVNRSRYDFLNNHLQPLGLSAGQFPALMLLAKEQSITQDTLARHYHLDMGTIARAVRNLENGGNIRMITDPGNRRAIRLFLTEKGAYAIHLLQGINRERETIITSGLPKEETAVLNSLMHRTTQNSFSILPKDGDPGDERE